MRRQHEPSTDGTNRIAADAGVLRDVMRRVPTPVAIVTVGGPVERRGITIGSMVSTSLDPPLLSFNVEKVAHMHDVLIEAPFFAVHFLSEDQAALSDHFALPDRSGEEQFTPSIAYRLDAHGTPILEGVVAVLLCVPYARYDAGDHSIFVGEVVEAEEGVGTAPLLYYYRSYRGVGEEPKSTWLSPVKRLSSDTP